MAANYVQQLVELEQGKNLFYGPVKRRLVCRRSLAASLVFNLCVVEEARLKVQYAVIGEQLKTIKLKKAQLMQRMKDAVSGGGECQRCRLLAAQVAELNRRLPTQPRRAPLRRRAENDDVEPSSDDSVTILDAP